MQEIENIYGNMDMPAQRNAATEMAASRQMQEVQGQIIMAKKFPRDVIAARNRILTACQRKRLAEQAEYEYKRGIPKLQACRSVLRRRWRRTGATWILGL